MEINLLCAILLTRGRIRKFIPPPWYKGGGGGGGGFDGTPLVLICSDISKPFYLQWKAFDLVALVEVCDVTQHGRHLRFYQKLEIKLKQCESTIFLRLTCKITSK